MFLFHGMHEGRISFLFDNLVFGVHSLLSASIVDEGFFS